MTDVPKAPRLPSNVDRQTADTEPPDNSTVGQLREMRAVLVELGAMAARLETRLLQHELAILTEEHQAHRAHERIDSLEERTAALEQAAE